MEHDSDDSAFDDDDDLADLAELAQLIDQPHRPSDKIHSRVPMASGLNDVPLRLGPSDIGTLKCLSSDGHLLGAGILATDTRIGDCATCGKIAYNSRPCKKCKRGCHATCLPGGICAGCVESTLEAELKPLMEIDPCVSCGEPCIGVAAMRCMQCNGRVHSASCSTEEMCNACYVSIAFTDPAVVAKPDPAVPQADALKRLRHVPPLEPGWEATIAPGQQLRGDVLTSYARALIQPHPDAVVVGGHTTSMMVSGVSMSMADLTRAKLVLFIVHDNALQHWSLAAWRTCTRTLWCYDSVPGCHREAQGRLGKWLSERYGIKLTVRRPACPAQHNSHDCGLFVLWFAEQMLNGTPRRLLPPPKDFRARVVSALRLVPGSQPLTSRDSRASDPRPQGTCVDPSRTNHATQPLPDPLIETPSPPYQPKNATRAPRKVKAPPNVVVHQHFHKGQSSLPGLAPTNGEVLKALDEAAQRTASQLAALPDGITIATRQRHVRLARALTLYAKLRPAHLELPPFVWISHAFQALGRLFRWEPSTRRTHFGDMLGLLSRLDQYAPSSANPPSHREASVLRDLGRLVTKEYNRSRGAAKPFFSLAEARALLESESPESTGPLGLLLLVAWTTSARPTNVIALRRKNFVFKDQGQMAVIFTDAKTTTKRGVYTVHTRVSNDHYNRLRRAVDLLPHPESLLFPQFAEKPEQALARLRRWTRRLRPLSTIRMIRRGSLIHLAESGASQELLLNRSGHTNLRQLHDYLGAQLHLKVLRTELDHLPASI